MLLSHSIVRRTTSRRIFLVKGIRARERGEGAWSMLHSHQQAWDQPSVHVCPLLQAQSWACEVSKDLSWRREKSRWLPSNCILRNIRSHHHPDRPTGRQTHSWIWIQKQPIFVYLNPMFLWACGWIFCWRRASGAHSWPTWWTCVLGMGANRCAFGWYPPIKYNLMGFSSPLKLDGIKK